LWGCQRLPCKIFVCDVFDKVCIEDVLSRAQVKRKLINDIRARQLDFLGYIIRIDGLENLGRTGKIVGKRSRGRRRVTWMSSVK